MERKSGHYIETIIGKKAFILNPLPPDPSIEMNGARCFCLLTIF